VFAGPIVARNAVIASASRIPVTAMGSTRTSPIDSPPSLSQINSRFGLARKGIAPGQLPGYRRQ